MQPIHVRSGSASSAWSVCHPPRLPSGAADHAPTAFSFPQFAALVLPLSDLHNLAAASPCQTALSVRHSHLRYSLSAGSVLSEVFLCSSFEAIRFFFQASRWFEKLVIYPHPFLPHILGCKPSLVQMTWSSLVFLLGLFMLWLLVATRSFLSSYFGRNVGVAVRQGARLARFGSDWVV